MGETNTIIVGAGHAGLALSYELMQREVDHVILERDRIGESWRRRWDSFCLVTPNFTVQLPGYPYDGGDPEGFMPRDDIVAYLERYADSFDAPVLQNTAVTSIRSEVEGGFVAETDQGQWRADNLVLATGAFQKAKRPAGAEAMPRDLEQLDLSDFTNADALPPGDVLIVGSGQSGCQLAEEIHRAGRRVVLACGRAPWMPRRIGDHDFVWWLNESGCLEVRAGAAPPEARMLSNIIASGHGGGHDLHLRVLQAMGVTLVGRFLGVEGNSTDSTTARFATDLYESVAWGDARYLMLRQAFLAAADRLELRHPDMPDPEPFVSNAPSEVDLTPFGSVIFAGGFSPDFTSWLPWPEAFDSDGFPRQFDGASTAIAGLYFVGTHFLRKRKSSTLFGAGEDAAAVAEQVAG